VQRARLAAAIALAIALAVMSAVPVSASTIYRTINTRASAPITIYGTFNHSSTSECPDAPNRTAYSVQMSISYTWSGGSTFKIHTAKVKYTVTSGQVWADRFVILPANGGRWPSSGPVFQGDYLQSGDVKTYSYSPMLVVARGATLRNISYYGYPGLPLSCDTDDYWAISLP
jgi:hypothetical protein